MEKLTYKNPELFLKPSKNNHDDPFFGYITDKKICHMNSPNIGGLLRLGEDSAEIININNFKYINIDLDLSHRLQLTVKEFFNINKYIPLLIDYERKLSIFSEILDYSNNDDIVNHLFLKQLFISMNLDNKIISFDSLMFMRDKGITHAFNRRYSDNVKIYTFNKLSIIYKNKIIDVNEEEINKIIKINVDFAHERGHRKKLKRFILKIEKPLLTKPARK